MISKKPLLARELTKLSDIIFEKTGFRLKDYLIAQAFTRSSYSKRFGGGSNENLEYIGDTVFGYHVVKKLYDYYGTIQPNDVWYYYSFRGHEKDFTVLKSRIVSNESLAAIIREWDVARYLLVGPGDAENEVDKQEKILADLLEAIIGAIAVQAKWDQAILEQVVAKILPIEDMIMQYEKENDRRPAFSADNAVTTLKEMAEREECEPPQYTFAGPDRLGRTPNGDPRWACRVVIPCSGIIHTVFAHSKKDAKKYAAYLALCFLYNVPNEYGPNKRLPIWGFDGEKLLPNPPCDF